MKKKTFGVLLGLVLLSAAPVPAYAQAAGSESTAGKSVGDSIEDFTVTLSDGKKVSLYEQLESHDAVFLNIWGSFCGPCQMEFPAMDEAAGKHPDIYVLAVSDYAPDSSESVAAYKENLGLSFIDMTGYEPAVGEMLVPEAYPTSLMIAGDGVVCWRETGAITDSSTFERLFEAFEGKKDSEGLVGFEIPPASPENYGYEAPSAPSSGEILKALALPDSFTFTEIDENAWPFLISGEGLSASNLSFDNTLAALNFDLAASSGAGLLIDLSLCLPDSACAMISVDDQPVRSIAGGEGDRDIPVLFDSDSANEIRHLKLVLFNGGGKTPKDPFFTIRSIRLLSDEEAAPYREAEALIPKTLSGTELSLESNGSRVHIWHGEEDISDQISDLLMLASEPTRIQIAIGEKEDPYGILVLAGNQFKKPLVELDFDEKGYYAELTAEELFGEGDVAYIYAADLANGSLSDSCLFFKDRSTLDAYMKESGAGDEGLTAGDEAGPFGEAEKEPSKEEDAGKQYEGYAFLITGPDGTPLEGAMLQVCDDDTCSVYSSDEKGLVEFDAANLTSIHLLVAPEGYSCGEEEIEIPEKGVLTTLVLDRKE